MDKITKQNALNAHTWVGVFLSVLLFLVCLSGTVAVFHLEFERWEQPHIEEMKNVSPEVVEKAMDTFLAQNTQESHHLYVVFPTSDIPRLVVENDHAAYFADSEGNLLEQESVSFTEMLVNLHLYLNLPQSWGMILVSALGAIICTLVVTGIIAHKRIAKDAFNARDTAQFTIDVIRVPRPHIAINIVQNNIFTNYYDILVTDTISKARNLRLEVQNEPVVLDTVGQHTFRGHHQFFSPGTYSVEVFADALVGDTTVFRSVGLVLARTLGRWSGSSPDGRFHVDGEAGAVPTDQSIMLVDSTMFKKGFVGSYRLGDELREFNDPVKVSLMSYQEDQAIYQRNNDDSWTELPSYYDQGRIVAYTGKMGYFRLGRKTLVVPGLTSLGQNYPNPFNPVTKISYDVGFIDGPQQHVNLSIYNLLGQHVQTLVDTEQTIGRHTVQWYGRDKTGMNVASGVYFMHMTTSSGKIQTKKVMLLR